MLEESKYRYHSGGFAFYTLCEIDNNQVRGVLMPENNNKLKYNGGFELVFYSKPNLEEIANGANIKSYNNQEIKKIHIPLANFNLTKRGVIIVQKIAPADVEICKIFPK